MNDDATPPPPIPPADLRVWWLTESDYCGFEPHQEVNPLCIPDYAWEQFRDRYGRAGWGRLWVPDHIQLAGLPVAADDPRWSSFNDAGGIVIESRHAAACARWGGTITTLTLDPVEVEVKDHAPYGVNPYSQRIAAEWSSLLQSGSIYSTTPELRDALTLLSRDAAIAAPSETGANSLPSPPCFGLRFFREKFNADALHERPAIDVSDGYCGIRDTLRLQLFDGNEWVDVPIVSQNA